MHTAAVRRLTKDEHLSAEGILAYNGHTGVQFNPHAATHLGNFDIRNVRSESCESVVRIGADDGTGTYGPNVKIDGVVSVPGSQAQLRDPAINVEVGDWLIGDSKYCIDGGGAYPITITNITTNGLPHKSWP